MKSIIQSNKPRNSKYHNHKLLNSNNHHHKLIHSKKQQPLTDKQQQTLPQANELQTATTNYWTMTADINKAYKLQTQQLNIIKT